MRHHPAKLNRSLLFVLGLLLLMAGTLGILAATATLGQLATRAGIDMSGPASQDPVLESEVVHWFQTGTGIAAVIVVGLLLAVAGLGWLLRQIPRRHLARTFRLQDDPNSGLTRVSPEVLTHAVERELRELPGVTRATVQLRGSAAEPELTLKVTAEERTDIRHLLGQIQREVTTDLQTALDATLARLAVRVEVDREAVTVGGVSL